MPTSEEIFSKPNIISTFNVNYSNFARDLNIETESNENEFDYLAMIGTSMSHFYISLLASPDNSEF